MIKGPVMLISDIHTKYPVINQQIEHAENHLQQDLEQVFVLGDFGFFADPMRTFFRRQNNRFARPVHCIEGNHEDHAALEDLAADFGDVVSLVQRGQLHALGPWRGLCLGGARYMDAAATPRGCVISEKDIQNCMVHPNENVDLVLTHDCPAGIGVQGAPGQEHYGPTGVPGLARLQEHFQPRWWFFGHHHRWYDLTKDETRFVGLPQSWLGYVILDHQGNITKIENQVPLRPPGRWTRWLRPGQWALG